MTLKNDSLRTCKNLQQSFVVYLEERLLSVRELFEDFGKQNAQTRKCFVFFELPVIVVFIFKISGVPSGYPSNMCSIPPANNFKIVDFYTT